MIVPPKQRSSPSIRDRRRAIALVIDVAKVSARFSAVHLTSRNYRERLAAQDAVRACGPADLANWLTETIAQVRAQLAHAPTVH
jgi:hypothetical protein